MPTSGTIPMSASAAFEAFMKFVCEWLQWVAICPTGCDPTFLGNACDKLMLALDALNQRYGHGTMKVSTQEAYQDW